jgi:hypothetical protein
MSALTGASNATANGVYHTQIAPANSPSVNTTYPVAGTTGHKRERGVNVSRQGIRSPSRLSLRARIEWAAFRALPPQGKRNKITTSLYLMRCRNAKNPQS